MPNILDKYDRAFVCAEVLPQLDSLKHLIGREENFVETWDEEREKVVEFNLVDVHLNVGRGASAAISKAYLHDLEDIEYLNRKSNGLNRGTRRGRFSRFLQKKKKTGGPLQIDGLTPLAIKRITPAEFEGYDEEFQRLLFRERHSLETFTELIPEHVTRFVGNFLHAPAQEHWFVLEYCGGGSLHNIVRLERVVDLTTLAALLAGALRGIEAIHKLGYVHGDIKAGNILLKYPGIVKICDFGLCIKLRGVADPDLHALGSLEYYSPELMLRNLAEDAEDRNRHFYRYGYKIDVWALGIVGLELLLGKTPMAELKEANKDLFSQYIAYMADLTEDGHPLNHGSALGRYFYIPTRVRRHLEVGHGDLRRLLRRVPVLNQNRDKIRDLLMRQDMINTTPDPSRKVARPKSGKLFAFNKCFDFIAQCLFINERLRPNSTQLQSHEFVKKACLELKALDGKHNELEAHWNSRARRKEIWKNFRCGVSVKRVNVVLEELAEIAKLRALREEL